MIDRPSRVVLVDDEEADRIFMVKAFERGDRDHEVTACSTAAELLTHLEHCHAQELPPDLVLLDLSLPGMSGIDALKTIRDGDLFPELIVIVLTSSSYRREVSDAYAAGANAFVTKPPRLADLDRLVQSIDDFWLSAAHRPYT